MPNDRKLVFFEDKNGTNTSRSKEREIGRDKTPLTPASTELTEEKQLRFFEDINDDRPVEIGNENPTLSKGVLKFHKSRVRGFTR